MRRKYLLFLIFWACVPFAYAYPLILKLPYQKGANFVVTRGYGMVYHINSDYFSLDFALGGCRTYGQPVLATADGVVIKMENWHKRGEKKSYGNMVMIEHSDGICSLYAHLSTVTVKKGDIVKQGQQIGAMGNTGNCSSDHPNPACLEQLGAHLHFTMRKNEKYIDARGIERERVVAYKPEPMSGYSNFTVNKYYKSDNSPSTEPQANLVEAKSEQKETIPAQTPVVVQYTDIDIVSDGTDHSHLTLVGSEGEIGYSRSNILSGFKIDENGNVSRKETAVSENMESVSNTVAPELSFEQKYNAKIVSSEIVESGSANQSNIVLTAGQEATVKITYQNIGLWDWQRANISLNILSSSMNVFYDGWMTKKRPAAIVQSVVKSNEAGNFVFKIKAPEQGGVYKFGVRPVVFYENDFHWIGNDNALWNIEVRERPKENIDQSIQNETQNPDSQSLPSGDISANAPAESSTDQKEESANEIGGENDSNSDNTRDISNLGAGGSSSAQDEEEEDMSSVETYLNDFPSDPTNEAQINFSFHSNFKDAEFKCKIDEGDFAVCVSPMAYNNLAEGSHTFEVKAFEGGKEDATPANHTFRIDRTVPLKIQDLEATSLPWRSVNVSGTFPEDSLTKIEAYYKSSENCSLEGLSDIENWSKEEIAIADEKKLVRMENNGFEFAIGNLDEGKEYCFVVKTQDAAGNISEVSDVAKAIVNNLADHLLISEVKLWGENKFIELYNPTMEDADLAGYSLQMLKDGDNKTIKVDFASGNKISSHGFFLVAETDFAGTITSNLSSSYISNLDGGYAVYLAKTNDYLVDAANGIMGPDSAEYIDMAPSTDLPEDMDSSLERKAHPNSTSELMLTLPHKYDGNGYDSDGVDDFLVRQIPEPQNSMSLAEPHKSNEPVVKAPSWNGTKYFAGENITLNIEISDLEDGALSGDSIIWSSAGKEIGRGVELSTEKLVVGLNNLQIEATDSDGEKSSGTFSVEIIENGWGNAIAIPGSISDYSSDYSAFRDKNGVLHTAFIKESSCANGYGLCGNSIYYQKNDGGFLSEPMELLKLSDYKIEWISTIDLVVDDGGIVRIVFTGPDLPDHTYQTYYADSSDHFAKAVNIFSELTESKIRVENNFVYISAQDNDQKIYYKKFSGSNISEDFANPLEESFYQVFESVNIWSYDLTVKNGELHFAVLYNNNGISPASFSQPSLSYLAMGSYPSVGAVSYVSRGTDGVWHSEFLEDKLPLYTDVYLSEDSSPYVLVNSPELGTTTLFAKESDNWNGKKLDLSYNEVFGFGEYGNGNLSIVSIAPQSDGGEILWQVYDGAALHKINLSDKIMNNASVHNLSYLLDKNGKEEIIFANSPDDGWNFELYYMVRE